MRLRIGPRGRLRALTAGVFVALAVPAVVLVQQAWRDLRFEAIHTQRVLAQELVARVDAQARALIAAENARPATDYAFLNLAGDPRANFVQRSPLAAFPPPGDLPGVVGYFEVDAQGRFATPLLPPGPDGAPWGVPAQELAQRRALAAHLADVLARSRLVRAPVLEPQAREDDIGHAYRAGAARESVRADMGERGRAAQMQREAEAPAGADARREAFASAPVGQAAFDALEARQRGGPGGEWKSSAPAALARKERSAVPALADAPPAARAPPPSAPVGASAGLGLAGAGAAAPPAAPVPPEQERGAATVPAADASAAPVRLFESEVDPLVLGRLESGHLVLYRRVWRDGARSVQGVLLDPQGLLAGLIGAAYRESAVARSAAAEVRFQGAALAHYAPAAGASYASAPPDGAGAVLLEAPLGAPFDALTLRFTAQRLPPGPGAGVVAWTALALALVLTGGLGALYALGARALALAQAQREFVTRVSHELRTPLTAIRMYGEMLVHGWADDARRAEYHRYIHDEAQRLSRLIESVLSFGRASRDDLHLTLTPVTVGELVDLLRSRLTAPVQAAGFTLRLDCPPAVAVMRVRVDTDAFTQVLMNLADNALKFAAQASVRVVEVTVTAGGGAVCFAVRDHGPGLARRDLKRAFRPFYRARSAAGTPGTGIGLALARALTHAMGGRLEARNAQPGAQFILTLPAHR